MNYQASSPKFLFFLLVIVNLLNFIDRGIIPGAITEFNLFIQVSINTDILTHLMFFSVFW